LRKRQRRFIGSYWKLSLALDSDFRCADSDLDLDWKMLPAARVEDDLNH
jgi:hypothetical protein